MLCEKCNGMGKVKIYDGIGTPHYAICDWCDGAGEYLQTNEEWFCQLPTEEKARWLYDHYVNARAEEFYGRPEKTLCDYQKWLVDVHKGIDGARVC